MCTKLLRAGRLFKSGGNMKKMVVPLLAAFALVICVPVNGAAEEKGKLDRFEEELSKPEDTSSTTTSVQAHEVAAEGIIQLFSNFFLLGLMQSGESSSELYRDLKERWSPAMPTFRLEPDYQYVKGGVQGMTWKGELGYLMFGIDGEYTRYFENNDHLDLIGGHLLLRSAFTDFFGANLAVGFKSLRGNRNNNGFEFGIPFYIFFSRHFILDVLPYIATMNGKDVYDIGGGLSFKYKYMGVRAGYRGLFVRTQTLHGPTVGIFFQW